MAQLKQATDKLRTQIDDVVASNRTDIATAIEGRKAELVASPYYTKATTTAQENVLRKVDQTISRVGSESQIALIREIGASFEASVYPELLDLLAASQQGGGDDTRRPRSRPCPLRPSRWSASPASLRRKRTSNGILPPSATRSSRP